jgi:hypothetical protein
MFRDRRLRNTGLGRQRPDRLLALAAQTLENSPPRGIGERSEQHFVGIGHDDV